MSNSNKPSLSVLYIHIQYIKKAIDSFNKKMDDYSFSYETYKKESEKTFNSISSRIQKIEDWKENENQNWNKKIQRYGIWIGILALFVSVFLNLINFFMFKR